MPGASPHWAYPRWRRKPCCAFPTCAAPRCCTGRWPAAPLRELLDAEPGSERWIAEFGRFLGQLHRQGVYFRSLHFGNLVVGDGGVFGLIDVADLEFRAAPLPPSLVVRNLRHLLRYPQDGDRVRAAHAAFRTGYDQTGQTLPASAASLLASP